jgi:hypothetical protein
MQRELSLLNAGHPPAVDRHPGETIPGYYRQLPRPVICLFVAQAPNAIAGSLQR